MNDMLATVVASKIESGMDVVDRVLAGLPNPVPSSGQLRHLRGRGFPVLTSPIRRARRPLLAAIGTADLLADQTSRLQGRPRMSSEVIRIWISDAPSKIFVSRASRQYRSTELGQPSDNGQ